MFAFLTSANAAERYLSEAKLLIPQNASEYDLYILGGTYGMFFRFQIVDVAFRF